MSANENAQDSRRANDTFVVTYLPEGSNSLSTHVLYMDPGSFLVDMIQRLPHFQELQDMNHDRDNLSLINEVCRVFKAKAEYLGGDQFGNAQLSRESGHVEILYDDWNNTPAQDLIITWDNAPGSPSPHLYMRYELRALDANRARIAPLGDSFGFPARSQLGDMSRILHTLK